MDTPITTDLDFARDGKHFSALRVPYSRNDSAWASIMIPIVVMKNGEGPTVLFTAGVHGAEYEGPIALMKLSRQLEADQISGRVIMLPALNLPAVQAGERLSPLDHKDLNRVFPGSPSGSVTEVIAHYVNHHILPMCEAVIDLHAGGYSLQLVPWISMHEQKDQDVNRRARAALEAFHAPLALIIKEFTGEGLLDYAVEGMGKLFLNAELGSAGTLSPRSLQIAERGVRNLLVHFGVLKGDIVNAASQGFPQTRFLDVPAPDYYHVAPVGGIYESHYELLAEVDQGAVLGRIHSLIEPWSVPRPVQAQQGGTLIVTRGPGLVEPGDTVAVLAIDRS